MPCVHLIQSSAVQQCPLRLPQHTLGRTADTAAQSSGAGHSLVAKGNALSLAVEPVVGLNEEEECGELEGA